MTGKGYTFASLISRITWTLWMSGGRVMLTGGWLHRVSCPPEFALCFNTQGRAKAAAAPEPALTSAGLS